MSLQQRKRNTVWEVYTVYIWTVTPKQVEGLLGANIWRNMDFQFPQRLEKPGLGPGAQRLCRDLGGNTPLNLDPCFERHVMLLFHGSCWSPFSILVLSTCRVIDEDTGWRPNLF